VSQLTIQEAFDLASRHHQAGRLQDAEQLYKQILTQQPDHSGAMLHLGLIARQVGRHDIGIKLIRQSIVLNPNLPEAHNNLGNALRELAQLDEAIAAYRQAILLKPNYPEALNNLGNALKDNGQPDDALAAYRQTIALNPNLPYAHFNLGNALCDRGQLDEAIAAYRQAILLRPNFADAHNNLGNALKDNGQLDEAVAAFCEAIALNPKLLEAHNNFGNALKDRGQLDEALAAYRQAIALNPSVLNAHDNLLYTLYFHPGFDPRTILAEHRRWNQTHARPLAAAIKPHDNDRSADRPLRIGYVSGDFRQHVVARNFLPVLEQRDRSQFTVHCYSNTKRTDDFTERLRRGADGWRNLVGIGDNEAAELIRADRIDILVDASLHMSDNRLLVFARKPAPVQATWLGYPGTTGLDAIDYRLTDPYLDPAGLDDACYSEQSVRLPHTFWCYDAMGEEPAISTLPCLRKSFITFGCLNNFCKINDAVLLLWADVLKSNAGSHLLCLAPEGTCRQTMRERLGSHGVNAGRVEFAAKLDRPAYLRLYEQIDIGLDTFPYNGHSTSLDSYWMGVPVITLSGRTVVGRAGVSQLNNLGLTELIAHSHEQYVQIATELANDRRKLSELRATLRERMRESLLMDARRFTRGVEEAYRAMWRKWTAT
jgi:predicted O-linked N-acetylglucosamine transferase (SPINDLY family)